MQRETDEVVRLARLAAAHWGIEFRVPFDDKEECGAVLKSAVTCPTCGTATPVELRCEHEVEVDGVTDAELPPKLDALLRALELALVDLDLARERRLTADARPTRQEEVQP